MNKIYSKILKVHLKNQRFERKEPIIVGCSSFNMENGQC